MRQKEQEKNIREALLSNQEKKTKEKPLHKITYTGKYGTRPKQTRRTKLQILLYTELDLKPQLPCPKSISHNRKKKEHFVKA